MKRLLTAVVIAAIVVACASTAPRRVVTAPALPTVSLRVADSVSLMPSPELQKSIDDLEASLNALKDRIATDPQLRAAAVHVASNFVAMAQQILSEQTVVLQQALKTAAETIDAQQHPAPKK